MRESTEHMKKLKEIVSKMKMLKATNLDSSRWHLSYDVYHRLLGSGYIVCMNEGRESYNTCMGIPVTVHYDLKNYVSIE